MGSGLLLSYIDLQRQRQLCKHDWVVYAKTPLGGPAQVLEYLSRYTHRTAISNERIRAVNEEEVAFWVRADAKGGNRLVRLDGPEFVRRFLLHVLPTGIKRIRHYGVLASACKGVKLPAARLALQMPAASPQAIESAQAFMARLARMDVGLCPCCKVGGCAPSLCWRGLRGWGACLGRPAPWRLTAGGRQELLPCLDQWTRLMDARRRSARCCAWVHHARPARTDSRAGRGLACSIDTTISLGRLPPTNLLQPIPD